MEMNIRPGLPIQTSGGHYSSSLSMPANRSEDYPKSPDPFPASTSRDLLANPMVSHNGQSNSDSPFVSGFPTDLHFPSFSPGEEPSQNGAFIFQSPEGGSHFPRNHNEVLDAPPGGYVNYDFSEGISIDNGQVGSTVEVVPNENDAKEIDWMEFAEDFCPGSVESNWNEFLADPNVGNQQPKLPQSSSDVNHVIVHHPQNQQQLSLPSREVPAVANPSTSAQSNKSRMRWTPELHEAFVEAINHLGGSERATPKCILLHMNSHLSVEGLTIQRVKSHLQKYRSAMGKRESSEGNSGERTAASEQVSSVDLRTSVTITEALRMQMVVQKQLHEQLEIQRKIQLKIEEQGKYLLQMLENQNKMEQEKCKALPNNGSSDDPPDNSKASGLDQLDTSTSSQAPSETSRGSKGKQTVSEGDGDLHPQAGGSSPPPTKRAKLEDPFHESRVDDQCGYSLSLS